LLNLDTAGEFAEPADLRTLISATTSDGTAGTAVPLDLAGFGF